MLIDTLYLGQLRNDEHFQFHTEVKDLALDFDPDKLRIKPQFESYLIVYAREDECIKKILKSDVTEKRLEADRHRDTLFRGFVDAVKSGLHHFDPTVTDAANRLSILLKTYGNLARKPYNEETSAIYNLVQDLKGKYAPDVTIVNLDKWVTELEVRNQAFEALMQVRFTEIDERIELKTKEERIQLDLIYHDITKHINALSLIENDPWFDDFIHKLNSRIEVYHTLLAQRKGRNAAKKEKE
jgi:hypothetical protein